MPTDIISAVPAGDSSAHGDRTDSALGVNRDRTGSDAGPNTRAVMTLTPTEAPGRITRKARQYEAAIAELRAQGYTLAAICRSLAACGVHVSVSTVRREAHRAAALARTASPRPHGGAHWATSQPPPPARPVARTTTASASTSTSTSTTSPPSTSEPVPRSAKDEAEAFARTHITNPLVRAKEQP